jgi:hypothetical protein
MWAFGDELRELYLVALFYLVWLIFFNVAGLFGKSFFFIAASMIHGLAIRMRRIGSRTGRDQV